MDEKPATTGYVLPKFCPICAEIMQTSTLTVDGFTFDIWKCPECGYEEVKD